MIETLRRKETENKVEIKEKQVYVEDVSKINRLLVEIQSFQTVLATKQDEVDLYKKKYEESCLKIT